MSWMPTEKDPKHVAREKTKARELRKSQWWKNKIALGVCHYCYEKKIPDELTMDHIVPLSRGGKSTKGNVVPCCKPCNSKKRAMTPAEIIMEKLKEDAEKEDEDG